MACWRSVCSCTALGTGRSILTAGLTLALLILPIIIVATREAIRAVPYSIREAAYGIGATKGQVTRDHVLPAALPGVLTGVIIGVSRALGETAPLITIGALTFIAFLPEPPITGEFPFISFRGCSTASRCCPIQAFNWISRPGSDFHANAAAAGLVLLALTLGLNAARDLRCAIACARGCNGERQLGLSPTRIDACNQEFSR